MPGASHKNLYERFFPSSQPPEANTESRRRKLRSSQPLTADRVPNAGHESRHYSSSRGYHSDANALHTSSIQNAQGSSTSRTSTHKYTNKQATSSGHSPPPQQPPSTKQPSFAPNPAYSHRSRQDTTLDPRIHAQNHTPVNSTPYYPHEQATTGSGKPTHFGSSQNGYNMAPIHEIWIPPQAPSTSKRHRHNNKGTGAEDPNDGRKERDSYRERGVMSDNDMRDDGRKRRTYKVGEGDRRDENGARSERYTETKREQPAVHTTVKQNDRARERFDTNIAKEALCSEGKSRERRTERESHHGTVKDSDRTQPFPENSDFVEPRTTSGRRDHNRSSSTQSHYVPQTDRTYGASSVDPSSFGQSAKVSPPTATKTAPSGDATIPTVQPPPPTPRVIPVYLPTKDSKIVKSHRRRTPLDLGQAGFSGSDSERATRTDLRNRVPPSSLRDQLELLPPTVEHNNSVPPTRRDDVREVTPIQGQDAKKKLNTGTRQNEPPVWKPPDARAATLHVTSTQGLSSPQDPAQHNSNALAVPKLVSIRAAQGPSSPHTSDRLYKATTSAYANDPLPADFPTHERHLSSDQNRANHPPQADLQSQPFQRKHQQNVSVSDTTVSHQTNSTDEIQGVISRTMQYANRAISPPTVSTSRTQTSVSQVPPRTSPHRSGDAGLRPFRSVDEKDLRSLSHTEVSPPMPLTAPTISKQQATSSQAPRASSMIGQSVSVSTGLDRAITSMNIASSGTPFSIPKDQTKVLTQRPPSASRGLVVLPPDQAINSSAAPVSVPTLSRRGLQPDETVNIVPHHKESSSSSSRSAIHATPPHHNNGHGANASISKASPATPTKEVHLQSSPTAKLAGSSGTTTTRTSSLRKEEISPPQSLKKPHDPGHSQPNAALSTLTPYPPSCQGHGHPTDTSFSSTVVPQMYVPPRAGVPSNSGQASCEKTQTTAVMSPVTATISKTGASVVPPKSITDTSKFGEKHTLFSLKVSPPSRSGTVSSLSSTPIVSLQDVDKGRLMESKLDEPLVDSAPKSAKDSVNSGAANQKIQDSKPLIVSNPPLHAYKKIMPFSDEKQQFAVPPVTVMQLTSTVVVPRRENLMEGEPHVLSIQSDSKHYKTGSASTISEKASHFVPSPNLPSPDLLTAVTPGNADSERGAGKADEITQRHISLSATLPQVPKAAGPNSQTAIPASRFPLIEDNYPEQSAGSKVSSSTRAPRTTSLQTTHYPPSLGITAQSESTSASPTKPSASLSSDQSFQPLSAQKTINAELIKPSQESVQIQDSSTLAARHIHVGGQTSGATRAEVTEATKPAPMQAHNPADYEPKLNALKAFPNPKYESRFSVPVPRDSVRPESHIGVRQRSLSSSGTQDQPAVPIPATATHIQKHSETQPTVLQSANPGQVQLASPSESKGDNIQPKLVPATPANSPQFQQAKPHSATTTRDPQMQSTAERPSHPDPWHRKDLAATADVDHSVTTFARHATAPVPSSNTSYTTMQMSNFTPQPQNQPHQNTVEMSASSLPASVAQATAQSDHRMPVNTPITSSIIATATRPSNINEASPLQPSPSGPPQTGSSSEPSLYPDASFQNSSPVSRAHYTTTKPNEPSSPSAPILSAEQVTSIPAVRDIVVPQAPTSLHSLPHNEANNKTTSRTDSVYSVIAAPASHAPAQSRSTAKEASRLSGTHIHSNPPGAKNLLRSSHQPQRKNSYGDAQAAKNPVQASAHQFSAPTSNPNFHSLAPAPRGEEPQTQSYASLRLGEHRNATLLHPSDAISYPQPPVSSAKLILTQRLDSVPTASAQGSSSSVKPIQSSLPTTRAVDTSGQASSSNPYPNSIANESKQHSRNPQIQIAPKAKEFSTATSSLGGAQPTQPQISLHRSNLSVPSTASQHIPIFVHHQHSVSLPSSSIPVTQSSFSNSLPKPNPISAFSQHPSVSTPAYQQQFPSSGPHVADSSRMRPRSTTPVPSRLSTHFEATPGITPTRVQISGHPSTPAPLRTSQLPGTPSTGSTIDTPSTITTSLPRPSSRASSLQPPEATKKKTGLLGLFRPKSNFPKDSDFSLREPPERPEARKETRSETRPLTNGNGLISKTRSTLKKPRPPTLTIPPASTSATPAPTAPRKISKSAPPPLQTVNNLPPAVAPETSKAFFSRPFLSTYNKHNVSTASVEAMDGTPANTVIGSPTQSTFGQIPGGLSTSRYQMPSEQDRFAATQEWRNNIEAAQTDRGTGRRRRPGVVFDLGPERPGKTRPQVSQLYGGQMGR